MISLAAAARWMIFVQRDTSKKVDALTLGYEFAGRKACYVGIGIPTLAEVSLINFANDFSRSFHAIVDKALR